MPAFAGMTNQGLGSSPSAQNDKEKDNHHYDPTVKEYLTVQK